MSFLRHIFGEKKQRAALAPLYARIVERGRETFWYREGGVPDTLDGRFDMVAAITALVLLRLESLGEAGKRTSVLLTEMFIDDMDATLRQIGIGDYVVGKHVGRMMSALGGRLAAFKDAGGDFSGAVGRNIFHEAAPSEDSIALVSARLQGIAQSLGRIELEALLAGELP